MSSIVSALDKHTPKQFGEKANVEYGWSNKMDENIVQYFFQLVRNNNHTNVERQLYNLLNFPLLSAGTRVSGVFQSPNPIFFLSHFLQRIKLIQGQIFQTTKI